MINLLPLEEKQKLFSRKTEKLATVLGIVVLVSLLCLVLILLSIKFYILAETDYQQNILKITEQKVQTPDFISFNNIIQKYNRTLTQLDSFYKREIYFSQILTDITNVPSPKGLYLTAFYMSRNGNGGVEASVSGFSDTRDNLLLFKQNIEANKEIENPLFSQDSWISPKNVNFSLTFGIGPEASDTN